MDASTPRLDKALRLLVWLLLGFAIACGYVWASVAGTQRLGLGWSTKPGLIVAATGVMFSIAQANRRSWKWIFAFLLCFELSLVVEFLSLSRLFSAIGGIGLVLVGEAWLLAGTRQVGPKLILCLVLGSYVEAVFLYNVFCDGQMMYFFKPGWAT